MTLKIPPTPKFGLAQPANPDENPMTMNYRVDNVPRLLNPIYQIVSALLGLICYAYYWICGVTCRVEIHGTNYFPSEQNYIFCFWHESWWSYFAVFKHHTQRHIWINHPNAYMRPIHILIRLLGVERLLLGSSGEAGRQAVNELAAQLRTSTHSTVISPDGPAGPAKNLKKGVLHLALHSGLPILPMQVTSSLHIALPSWDEKKLPLPFSKIHVIFGDPIFVTAEDVESMAQQLSDALGD